MPLSEYILLALLGSSAISPGATAGKTLAADTLVQPKGGAMAVGVQDEPKKDGGGRRRSSARRVHRHRRHPIKHYSKDKKGSKI